MLQLAPTPGRFGHEGRPPDGDLLFARYRPAPRGRGSLGAAMAPGHLSVREMREDEKPLVLEMLKVRSREGPQCVWGCRGLSRAQPPAFSS